MSNIVVGFGCISSSGVNQKICSTGMVSDVFCDIVNYLKSVAVRGLMGDLPTFALDDYPAIVATLVCGYLSQSVTFALHCMEM